MTMIMEMIVPILQRALRRVIRNAVIGDTVPLLNFQDGTLEWIGERKERDRPTGSSMTIHSGRVDSLCRLHMISNRERRHCI